MIPWARFLVSGDCCPNVIRRVDDDWGAIVGMAFGAAVAVVCGVLS